MMRSVIRLYADAFRGLPATVWSLSAGLFVNRAGTMVLPFLSLYLIHELGFSTAAASVILLSFGLGSVVGSYVGGWATGRVGALSVQIWSLLAGGAGFLVLGQVRGFVALLATFFVVSAISDAFRPACMAAVVEWSPPAVRTRALGLMRLAANAGMVVGPAAGGFLAGVGYGWLFVGDGLTCWASALWLLRALRGRGLDERSRSSGERTEVAADVRSLWRDGTFLTLLGVVMLATLVLFQIFNTLPPYLASVYGLSERQIGLVFAWNAILIVLFEMPLIRRLEHREAAPIVGLGMFLMCAGFGLFPWGRGLAWAVLPVTVFTVGEMLMIPFSNVLVAARAGPGRVGQAMGMYTSVFSVALIVAPVVGFSVYERFGGTVLWVGAGLVGIPLWAAMALLARRS